MNKRVAGKITDYFTKRTKLTDETENEPNTEGTTVTTTCSTSCTDTSAAATTLSNTSSSVSESSDTLNKKTESDEKKPFSFSSEECCGLIQKYFTDTDIKVHNYFKCHGVCSSLSVIEKERIKPKKFLHDWLKKDTWWLCFTEGSGMYCLICKKHSTKNLQNKSEKFTEIPSDRFKTDAIETHMKSDRHKAAISAELVQQFSVFHKEYVEKNELCESVMKKAFSTAYFLMKHIIANHNFWPMINFMKNVIGVNDLKYFKYTSARSLQEIFLTIGTTMKKSVLEKVQNVNYYGLMTDEMTDISVSSQLVTFLQYYDHETKLPETVFLSVQNVLEKDDSANANTIYKLLKQEIAECELDQNKLIGLSTDGAAVMVGSTNGVARQLRNDNPLLINCHCVCHKLALACTDSNEQIKYIKIVEDILRQLWQYFENSPKRMALFIKVLSNLKKVRILENNRKKVYKKLKKACKTRWLSFDSSVNVVKDDYEGILLALSELDNKNEATATGILKKMKHVKFLGVIYILAHVLPILSKLSKVFQKSSINFSQIVPMIKVTKQCLLNILETKAPLEELMLDLESYQELSGEIHMSPREFDELERVMIKYIEALIENIDKRFESSSHILTAFGVFDPTCIPDSEKDPELFKTYGEDNISTIANHFYQKEEENVRERKTEKLKSEWLQLKYHVESNLKDGLKHVVDKKSVPPTEWLLLHILDKQASFAPFFPLLLDIIEAVISIPISNAWPERGASSIKNVKSRLRSRLTNQMLETILHVLINGPPVEKSSPIIDQAVCDWLSAKKRKKLPKRINSTDANLISEVETVVPVETREVGVQIEVINDPDKVIVEENLKSVSKAFGLDFNNESECDDDDDDDDYGYESLSDFEF